MIAHITVAMGLIMPAKMLPLYQRMLTCPEKVAAARPKTEDRIKYTRARFLFSFVAFLPMLANAVPKLVKALAKARPLIASIRIANPQVVQSLLFAHLAKIFSM